MKPAIPAAGEAVPAPPTIRDLETVIADAQRMCSISIRLLERTIGGKAHATYGSLQTYHLSKDEIEDIMFSVIKTEAMIDIVWAKWESLT